MAKKIINIRIEPEQERQLILEAKRLGVTKSEMVRRIIRAYMFRREALGV